MIPSGALSGRGTEFSGRRFTICGEIFSFLRKLRDLLTRLVIHCHHVPVQRHRSVRSRPEESHDESEEQLVTTLYREYGGPLLRNVRRLTGGDQQWAEDVVQETVFRAWRNAGKLNREPGLLWAWLMTVARRIVIDARRQRSVRPQEVEPDRLDSVAIPDGSEPMLSAMVVSEALYSLSPEHREALVQTYLHDRTINEAAEVLGVPPGTVKSRVYYALRALQKTMKEKERG
ncbi:sigma-70 family RNA polymerase sigma factor [Sphaerisporangium melleum]|uniref:sigma-70 family RNA polymerase sigma factor n=1 Tax=Sphaerisporangium melleum TaxID=321316 RepID=UPI001E621F7E|nr:sigma-70 family RNA polymerase sigma factor [Sphaerisporangium melleum]